MRFALASAAIVAPLVFLTACDEFDFGNIEQFKEDFHLTYPLAPGGRVSLENLNGSVEISSWEKDSVEINGTKYAHSQPALKDIKIDVSATPGVIQVRTVPALGIRNMGARYSIRVPRRVQLDRIVTSNGGIRIDDIEGMVSARSSNGTIRLWHLKGCLLYTSDAADE